jgi:cell division protein FtsB
LPKRPAAALSTETIATRIHLMRGEKVLLDEDLVAVYGVQTRRLNEQGRRNCERFPADFIFQLTAVEMSVYVVRAFVRMRAAIGQNKEIAKKLDALERRIDSQDETIVEIVQAIRQLTTAPPRPPETKRRPIGFVTPKEK